MEYKKIKDSGRMITSTDSEPRYGQIMLNTQESSKKERNTEREDYNLVMALVMKELSSIMKYQDMAYTSGQTKEFTRENGLEIRCKEKEL